MAVAGVLRTEAQQARAGGQHSPIFLGIATLRFLNVGIQARCVGVMVCGRSVRLGDKALATDLSASWGRFADSQWSLGESGVGRFNRALPPTPARASAGSAARAGPSPCSCRGVFDGDERQAGQLDALARCESGISERPKRLAFDPTVPRRDPTLHPLECLLKQRAICTASRLVEFSTTSSTPRAMHFAPALDQLGLHGRRDVPSPRRPRPSTANVAIHREIMHTTSLGPGVPSASKSTLWDPRRYPPPVTGEHHRVSDPMT
jgi:hypothetical protein